MSGKEKILQEQKEADACITEMLSIHDQTVFEVKNMRQCLDRMSARLAESLLITDEAHDLSKVKERFYARRKADINRLWLTTNR